MAKKYKGSKSSYGSASMRGELGHDGKVHKCNPFEAQKQGMSGLNRRPMKHRGYPKEAYGYKY